MDRYIKGESHTVFCLRCGNCQEFLALIQREDWTGVGIDHPGRNGEVLKVAKPIQPRVGCLVFAWSQGTAAGCKTRGQQKAMLVYDVEFVELPKQMTGSASFVWLDTVESISARLRHSLYVSVSQLTVVLDSTSDWEVCAVYGFLYRGLHNGISEMIECATEIVEGISQNETDCMRNDRKALDVIDCVASCLPPRCHRWRPERDQRPIASR